MSWLVAIILGAIQGLTEFLPVSSSGHLILLNKLFGIQGDFLLITVLLHLATLFAVIYVFRAQIWQLIKAPFSKEAVNLYIATIPTILIVLLIKWLFEDNFTNPNVVPYGFLITAILLLLTYLLSNSFKIPEKKEGVKYISYSEPIKRKSALIMGIVQGFAVMPGISRSGSTICTGLLAGENREDASKFSFLMSIPIIIAAMLYEIITADVSSVIETELLLPTLLAFITAFIVGILSIKLMLTIVKKAKYYWFSVYLVVIAIASFFIIS
jgi:undecaprenyl-diphosphatase